MIEKNVLVQIAKIPDLIGTIQMQYINYLGFPQLISVEESE